METCTVPKLKRGGSIQSQQIVIPMSLGLAAVGKGQMACGIAQHFGVPVVATGNMLRSVKKAETETDEALVRCLGPEYTHYVQYEWVEGELAREDVVQQLIRCRLSMPDCHNGCAIDGLRSEADIHTTMSQLLVMGHTVVPIELFIESGDHELEILARITGREICSRNSCQQPHNSRCKETAPRTVGVCNACGSPLKKRKEDTPEYLQERWAQERPRITDMKRAINGYDLHVHRLSGRGTPDDVLKRVLQVVNLIRSVPQ